MRHWKTKTLVFPVILLALSSCNRDAPVVALDDDFVTVYPIRRVNPAANFGHEWLPLNPTTYRVGDNVVVGKTAQFLHKYSDCAVLTKSDWECRYNDRSGFGMREGTYWVEPVEADTKYVSRFDYMKLHCEWQLNETDPDPSPSALAKCMASGP
jgi:hypothetical protein